ncbi:hypothetical protein CHARACLAT_003286, partial [Characodon lateralis]|nr:hypothetical protein [Characodon lateralis]
EVEEDAPPSPQPKPTKVPPETKPKPVTPPPITASGNREEEDEGDKIMAELQNTSAASPTSRMPVPLSAKSRQSPATTDKAGKQQKLQDAQRQFRQTQNGRVHSSSSSSSASFSSSSFSPSPLSPTPLGPGGKSIRTIHTPSFTSYRSHNGSSGKSSIPTATAAKDTT